MDISNNYKIACYCNQCYNRQDIEFESLNKRDNRMITCKGCKNQYPYPTMSDDESYISNITKTLSRLKECLCEFPDDIIQQIFDYSMCITTFNDIDDEYHNEVIPANNE